MKKDKEWLKGLINEEGIVMDMNLLNRLDEQYWKNENIKINKGRLFYLIDQLDEPEVLSQKWVDENVVEGDFRGGQQFWYGRFIEEEKVRNLLVPKQDKPVIPQFVADYIEKWKHEGLSLSEWLAFDHDNNDENKTEKWLYHNDDETKRHREFTFIDAIRYGYEVEKEKLYHVINKENYFMLRKYDGLVDIMQVSSTMSRNEFGKDTRFMLTEQEIKDYDKRFWAFAEEVEE